MQNIDTEKRLKVKPNPLLREKRNVSFSLLGPTNVNAAEKSGPLWLNSIYPITGAENSHFLDKAFIKKHSSLDRVRWPYALITTGKITELIGH